MRAWYLGLYEEAEQLALLRWITSTTNVCSHGATNARTSHSGVPCHPGVGALALPQFLFKRDAGSVEAVQALIPCGTVNSCRLHREKLVIDILDTVLENGIYCVHLHV